MAARSRFGQHCSMKAETGPRKAVQALAHDPAIPEEVRQAMMAEIAAINGFFAAIGLPAIGVTEYRLTFIDLDDDGPEQS